MGDRAQTEPGMTSACKFNDILIEALGVNGKNGRLGNAEKAIRELRGDMKKVKAEQVKMQLKIMLLTSASAAAGGGVVAGVMQFLTP